jgi:putative NADH-flavin reductase
MNVIIFGATGGTGRHLVEQALDLGHSVTAFVRDPARMPRSHPLLRRAIGDVLDPSAVDSAMPGHDAVLCALGTMPESKHDRARRQPKVPVCSEGTKNIAEAMAHHGVRRIVVESAASIGASRNTSRFGAALIVRLLLKESMEDKERQEAVLEASTLDWTIIRPPRLSDGPRTRDSRFGDALPWSLISRISRADIAAFMVAVLNDASTCRRAITVLAN